MKKVAHKIAKAKPKPVAKPAVKQDVAKHEVKHEVKHAVKHEIKHEIKPEAKSEPVHSEKQVEKKEVVAKDVKEEEPAQDTHPASELLHPADDAKADKYPIPPEDPSYHPPKEHHHVVLIVSIIVIIVVAAIIGFVGLAEKPAAIADIVALKEKIVTVEKTVTEQVPLVPDLTTYIDDVEMYDRQNIQTIGFAKYVKDGAGSIVVSTAILTDSFGHEIKLEKLPKQMVETIRNGEVLVNVTGVYYRFSGDTVNRPRLVLSSIEEINPYVTVTKTVMVEETVMG